MILLGFCLEKRAIFPLIFVLHVVIVMGKGVKNGKIFIMRFLRDANMPWGLNDPVRGGL